MEAEKRVWPWKRALLGGVYTLLVLFIWVFGWTFFLSTIVNCGLIPLAHRMTAGGLPIGIILFLGLNTALSVCMLVLFLKNRHRFFALFFLLVFLSAMNQAIPYLDQREHIEEPELAATVQMEKAEGIDEIYHHRFPYASSCRSAPNSRLPKEVQSAIAERITDRRYTWIVTYGKTLQSVTWSFRDAYPFQGLPWVRALHCPAEMVYGPGDENTVYIYRIPLAPIDNIF